MKNTWQVAAYSHEIGRELLSRTLLGEPILMYRTSAGEPVAMADICPHRSVPLSLGKLNGDTIQCGYHGLCFDHHGNCIKVPGQDEIPEAAKVKIFPVVERYSFVWIWMGDAAKADTNEVPDFHWMTDPDWAVSEGYHHIKANYQLLNDNLLDLSHETFVHPHTIGAAAVAESPLVVTLQGTQTVRGHRDMLNCDPPAYFVKTSGFTSKIDRWHTTFFTPPGFHVIENGSMLAGSDKQAARAAGQTRERRVLNLITPETGASSHYFWAVARRDDIADVEMTNYIRQQTWKTFDEDKIILEAQQIRLGTQDLSRFPVTLRADAAAVQGRRLLASQLRRHLDE